MTPAHPTELAARSPFLTRAAIAAWQQQLCVADAGPCATSFAELDPAPARGVQLTDLILVCGGDDPWPSGTCFPELDAAA